MSKNILVIPTRKTIADEIFILKLLLSNISTTSNDPSLAVKLPALSLNGCEIWDSNAALRVLHKNIDKMDILALDIDSLDKSHLKILNHLHEEIFSKKSSKLRMILASTAIYALIREGEKVDPKWKSWFEEYKQINQVHWKKFQDLLDDKGRVNVRKGIEFVPKPAGVKVTPKENERNILITSALPYVNNVPHLGNIIGCVLSADVFARYSRLKNYNTLYICGTDEYGTATETKALEEGVTCQELCDKYHKIHKEVYDWFEIDFDYFGRTTTPKHTEISQGMFTTIYNNGYFHPETIEQLFCEHCQRFLADRYVEGTCPTCHYTSARGDQCDGCGKLLNATELVSPRCKQDGNTPILKLSKHLFLDLPSLQPQCENFVKKSSEVGKWTTNGKSITWSWLNEGLKPRCMTRDMKWGTPVPLDEMKSKVLYVWFDAPIGYLSISANYTSDWELWWKNPKNVQLYQFMGKDNVPFHTVIFPCTLFGTKEDYTMLHHLSTTEYLNYEGDKFSKSRGVGVFGNNVMESGIPCSVWRYYLISTRPENQDSNFTWADMGQRTSSELLANLGNFVNRCLKFLQAKYNSVVPSFYPDSVKGEGLLDALDKEVNKSLVNYCDAMEEAKLRLALSIVMSISSRGNQFLQDNKVDNHLFENERKKCDSIIHVSVNLVYLLVPLLYCFMPSTSSNICSQLNAPMRRIPDKWVVNGDIDEGHVIGEVSHLFDRISDKQIDSLLKKYGKIE